MSERLTTLKRFVERIENRNIIIAIKYGLVELIPIFMIGAFSLALKSMPWSVYQTFIQNFGNGILKSLLQITYNVTFGMLSVYVTISISYQISRLQQKRQGGSAAGWIISSLSAFFILSGQPGKNLEPLGPKGMFLAVLAVGLATNLLSFFHKIIRIRHANTRKMEVRLERSLQMILPTLLVILVFALANTVILRAFGAPSIYSMFQTLVSTLFGNIRNHGIRCAMFVWVSSLFWFMGIHGSDLLESVVDGVFVPAGSGVETIFTRPFLDSFILMGGCGASLCLLLSILLFAKKDSMKNLGKISLLPAIFNINEVLVYGLPVVYNLHMLLPFTLVPLVCLGTSFLSMKLGIVPLPVHGVEWTTPLLLSGYLATGSLRGTMLQLFNLALGTLIYTPFVRSYQKQEQESFPREYAQIVEVLREAEEKHEAVSFLEDPMLGLTAKNICSDLREDLTKNRLALYYQPQFNVEGACIGAEALLRWEHPVLGSIYPPLVFQLAEESGFLETLEEWVAKRALSDAEDFQKIEGLRGKKVSFNVTGNSIQNSIFEEYLLKLANEHELKKLNICVEITEQAALQVNDEVSQRLNRLSEAGYRFAVDDFSMGSTSIKYLTGNSFSTIKLDGYLVRKITTNQRCYEIISHIIALARSLNVDIIAEYVSDKQIQEKLLEAGCTMYQGWYYSKPITREEYGANYGNSSESMVK